MLIKSLVLLLGFLTQSPELIEGSHEGTPGWDAFVKSDFEEALNQSKAANSADGYALACRSATVIGGYFKTGDEAVDYLHQAIRHCEKALELEPTHLIGKMTYAMTIGFEGKRLTSPSYAKASRRVFEEISKEHPESPMAQAAIAGWHSEVHAAGFFARLVLNPSRKEAKEGFDQAFALGKVDLPLQIEYVKFLARGRKADRQKAIKVLDDVLMAKPAHGFERILQDTAKEIRAALKTGKRPAIKTAIKKTTAFHGIEGWTKAKKLKLSSR